MKIARMVVGALIAVLAAGGGPAALYAATAIVQAPPASYALTVVRTGSGSGAVAGGTIDCGVLCSDSYDDGTVISLTATPAAGSLFTGWLGPCTGTGICEFTIGGPTTAVATFTPATFGTPSLDIDGNFICDALTDGLLVVRYLFGRSGDALTSNALGPVPGRSTATQIGDYLSDIRPALDIDGNGDADALTDGLLIIRYLFGLRGAGLIADVIGPNPLRFTAPAIEARLAELTLPAIYVSTTGSDVSPGTAQQPKRTVNAGIAAAGTAGIVTVLVAVGDYTGGITLNGNLTVRGGYDSLTWLPAALGQTTIYGGFSGSQQQYTTVLAFGLAGVAALTDMVVVGPDASIAGKGSYGIAVISSTVSVTRVTVMAGDGANGVTGSLGSSALPVNATATMNGTDGGDAQTGGACNATGRGAAGAAGVGVLSGTNGGAGGAGGKADQDCGVFSLNLNSTNGVGGSNAATIVAGTFGVGSAGGGADSGAAVAAGLPGRVTDGAGGGAGVGVMLTGDYLTTFPGNAGGTGLAGTGGGGGGGSGGNDAVPHNSYGAGGGGGGAGGAPGAGGGGGSGGGPSIGIYARNSTITVANSSIVRGKGGNGGAGGPGGQGQSGGTGGLGGAGVSGASPAGGNGGTGGRGGHGGGGGGGAGGVSAGIVRYLGSAIVTGSTYSGGTVGTGGAGGPSAPAAPPAPPPNGNPGAPGQNGQLATILVIP